MAVTSPAPSIRVSTHAPPHRPPLMSSTIARSDLDFPFQPPSSSSTAAGGLLAGVIDLLELEQAEPQQRNAELLRMRHLLDVHLHDSRAASGIPSIAGREWIATGDVYDWPYCSDSNPIDCHDLVSMEHFNLYSKGLLAEDENQSTLGAIGVVICDSTNSVLLKASKPLAAAEVEGRGELAEMTALIHGLGFAFCLGLQTITYHCNDHRNFLYLTGKQKAMDAKVADFLDSADHVRQGFSDCRAARATEDNQSQLQAAMELVRSSIQQQSGIAENRKQKPITSLKVKRRLAEKRKVRLKVKRRLAEKRKAWLKRKRLAERKNTRLKLLAEKKKGRQRGYDMFEFAQHCNAIYRRCGEHGLNQFLAELREERAYCTPGPSIPETTILDVEVPSTLDRYRSILDEHFNDGNQWQITIPLQVFHYEHFDIPIGKDEIKRWLDQDEIEASHISVYIRYLVENHCTGVEDMFGFLCPNRISPGYIGGSVKHRAEYVASAMEGDIRNKIFFGPYNTGGHWVLIVFSPQLDYAYWIDSLHGRIREDAVRLVEMSHALKYSELGGMKPRSNTQWRRIQCPLQTMLDCGYYVLRFMREIIEQRCLHIPCNWYDDKETYSQADIDEIRTEWMEFVFDLNT